MKKIKFKKMFAFSLVELMISLITISCIAAAFTPVITKKLKKQDVALSLAQTSEITNQCSGYEPKFTNKCKLCTKAYCIQCGIENCEDGKYLDTSYCGCKNCSENKTVVPDNCEDCKKCVTCTKDKCTKCEVGYYLKGLDGVVHTTCQKCGKTAGRNNYCFDGIVEQSPDYCDNPPSGYFCSGNNLKLCKAQYTSTCSTCNGSQCLSCISGYFLNSSKQCQQCHSGCASCNNTSTCLSCSSGLLNTSTNLCESFTALPNCREHTGTLQNYYCTNCYSGYYLKDGVCVNCKQTVSNCIYCEKKQAKCQKCENGYYINSSGGCSQCTITNCSSCSSDGKCANCIQGYHLSDDLKSCIANNNGFNCSDNNFMQIGKLCVTRRNMGDSSMLQIPSSVIIAEAGVDTCLGYTDKCCWKGKTSLTCNSDYGDYSGCDRTVCNWLAAKEICSKFSYGGKSWRLATIEEMHLWYQHSLGLGNNGLQLCDGSAGYLSSQCSQNSRRCLGSYAEHSETCFARLMWSGTNYPEQFKARNYSLDAAYWNGPETYPYSMAFSVRCVTEMDD